jgi:hypothetical protein
MPCFQGTQGHRHTGTPLIYEYVHFLPTFHM